MKKVFVCLLAIILMGLMTFNTAAAEAVADLTRYDTASLNDFPELVTDKTVSEHRLLERRKDDEGRSLNTLAYQKEDGQNVAFVYPYDVKYTDKNGKIKDKSREIVKDGLFSSTSFKTKDNDILSYFSINDDGNVEVITTYGDYSITSVIENRNQSNKITASKDEDGKLLYTNAVDSGIHLMYEPQYNGVKEYVVLDANLDHEFEFTMDFVGLTPVLIENNGGVALLNADGEEILSIPPIYVEDAAGQGTYENDLSLQQVDGDTYVMKITVDQAFLADEGTIYPVYVDPSVTVYSDNIEDTLVHESTPTSSYGSRTDFYVCHVATEQRMYSYIKFNNLFTNLPTSVSYQNILSAYLEVYELSGTNDTVLIDVVPASAAWSESALTWDSQPYFHNEIIGKTQVGRNSAPVNPDFGTRGLYRIYISNLVRGWRQGLPNYGIVLKSSYNTGMVQIGSSEGDTSKAPTLTIVYVNDADYPVEMNLSVPGESNQFYIKNKRSGKYLTAASASSTANVYQSDFTGNNNQKWTLEYVPLSAYQDRYYQIKLYDTDYVLDVYCGSVYEPSGNANGTKIQLYPKGSGGNQLWRFIRNWNGTYKIMSNLAYDAKGLTIENASISNNANCILYTHNVNFSYNDDWTLEPINLYSGNFYSFTKDNYDNVETVTGMSDVIEMMVKMKVQSRGDCVNDPASHGLTRLPTSNIWYFAGHGGQSLLSFKNDSGVRTYITANTVSNLDSNSLRNLYMFATNCCLAGDSQTSNSATALDLIGIIYRKGAHFAFATPNVSHNPQNTLWMQKFSEYLAGQTEDKHASYYEAIQYADAAVMEAYNNSFEAMKSCARHYAGDSSIILYHNMED